MKLSVDNLPEAIIYGPIVHGRRNNVTNKPITNGSVMIFVMDNSLI